MSIYAMTVDGFVIDRIEANEPPEWPPTPDGTPVVTVELVDEYAETNFDLDSVRWNGEAWEEYIPEPEPEPEPTQLDRIETAINLSQQEIIDNYTLELLEGGVI